jgi:hypothetical protein
VVKKLFLFSSSAPFPPAVNLFSSPSFRHSNFEIRIFPKKPPPGAANASNAAITAVTAAILHQGLFNAATRRWHS